VGHRTLNTLSVGNTDWLNIKTKLGRFVCSAGLRKASPDASSEIARIARDEATKGSRHTFDCGPQAI
jgi:hypothetical protein